MSQSSITIQTAALANIQTHELGGEVEFQVPDISSPDNSEF